MASNAHVIQAPGEFDFSRPETWPKWIKRFERYISVTGLSDKSEQDKINLLCYTMGEKSEEVMIQVMPSITASTRFAEVKAKFDAYFSPKRNVIFERYKFNSRVRETGETVDSFVTALHSLAETCEYGVLRNDLIRDRIVIGIRDTRASERLQLINDLTLEKALEIARQAEIQAKEGKTLRHATDEETEVNRVFQKRRNFRKQKSSEDTLRREEQTCGRCGYPNHTPDRKCPVLRSTC
ncbi:hypothetical protein X777_16444, partial [Ooceraea biroi]